VRPIVTASHAPRYERHDGRSRVSPCVPRRVQRRVSWTLSTRSVEEVSAGEREGEREGA
jgi:hypothetical protein